MKIQRTKYLSIRVTPKFDEFLKVIAAEFGLTKSRYARWVLVQELKRQKARHHVLGWDRPKDSQDGEASPRKAASSPDHRCSDAPAVPSSF